VPNRAIRRALQRVGLQKPDPPPIPFAERSARADELELLAGHLALLWNNAQAAKLLEADESAAIALIASTIKVRAARMLLLGR